LIEEENLEIEEFLSSKTRIKILRVLYNLGELNIRRICQKIGSAHPIVKKNLGLMEEMGLVKCKQYGKVKLYSLNDNNPKVKALTNLFEAWQTK